MPVDYIIKLATHPAIRLPCSHRVKGDLGQVCLKVCGVCGYGLIINMHPKSVSYLLKLCLGGFLATIVEGSLLFCGMGYLLKDCLGEC